MLPLKHGVLESAVEASVLVEVCVVSGDSRGFIGDFHAGCTVHQIHLNDLTVYIYIYIEFQFHIE